MKFVILCTFLMTSAVSSELTTISYCNWVVTNTTLKYENGTKYIETNLIHNKISGCSNQNIFEPDDQRIYKTHIAITDCDKNGSSCGDSEASIENVNCEDFSESENNPCTVAKKVADLEKNQHWLTQNGILTQEDLYNTIFCFDNDDDDSSSQYDD
ncbi:uncharacterized protein LOC114937349 isoform X2 [Nylanderia fulva]|uniref:uncharacterized protein LOC114937349 isoform X2 n=1 Tax=Nylanderia fulva TaxID=613905 RepID=UPI0010FBB059|nr:uncharacterized protein LOC114937349 isoform X2 [Nylanderia fulva]